VRKRELKRRLEEFEAAKKANNDELEKLGVYAITGQTVYVSAPEPYIGAVAVIDKLLSLDKSPTSLVVSAQYIPPGVDGEPGYFAASGTASN
jgi:hypothetical protein